MNAEKKSEHHSIVNSTRTLYRGRQFSFVVEQVTHPNGVESEMGIVRHPGSTVIVPDFEDGTVGLIRQYRHAVGEFIYETPAGTMEPDEDPTVCARRELEEETGYAAGELIPLGKTYLLPAYSDEVTHLFLAQKLRKTTQDLDDDEIIQVIRRPLENVLEMISDGEIIDALSILSIYHAVAYINKMRTESKPG